MYASGNNLHDADGQILGTFSSHWAACAAMIRTSNPSFTSLGGDKPEELAVEKLIAQRREGVTQATP